MGIWWRAESLIISKAGTRVGDVNFIDYAPHERFLIVKADSEGGGICLSLPF